MAELTNRNDDFIKTLLSVRGRVRPCDVHGVNEFEAAGLLESFKAAHPEMGLVIDSGVLTVGHGAVAAPSMPMAAAVGSYGEPPAPSFEFSDPLPEPYAAPVAVVADAEAPPFAVSAPAAPESLAPIPAAPAPDFGAQAPDFGMPASPAADDWLAGADGQADAFSQALAPQDAPVAWYWWLLPVFATWLGGLIAWYVLRADHPTAAKKLLIVGIVLTVLPIVLGILFFVLGLGGALLAM